MNHPLLLFGSPYEKQLMQNFFNCAYYSAQQSECTQKAMEAYTNAVSMCIDFLDLGINYSLSMRLYDNSIEALKWLENIEYPNDNNVYSASTAIYSNKHSLRCDSLLLLLGVPCYTDGTEESLIDWNAYCCIIPEF